MPLSSKRWRRTVVLTFFGILFALGIGLHRDYGVSWDEPVDHMNGVVNATYLMQQFSPALAKQESNHGQIPALQQYGDNDHGVLIELPLTLVGRVFTHGDPRSFYFLRHLCLFCLFLVGVWSLYKIATLRFGDWRVGLGVATMLVLSPRFFAEAFYNAKDIGFLVFFTLAIYTLLRYRQRPTTGRAVLHGIATAAAIDVRVLGVLLIPLTVLMLILSPFGATAHLSYRTVLRTGFFYFVATAGCMILGWPYLWEAPWAHLLSAVSRMSHYHWDSTVLYWGRLIPAAQLPWHYLPVWIFITTPLTYSLLAGLGVVLSARRYARPLSYLRTEAGQLDLLFFCWLTLPVLSVILLHSVVYDGWRHVYFMYPALLLFAGHTIAWLLRSLSYPTFSRGQLLRYGVLLLGMAGVVRTLVLMIQMHPFQQVYFSFLPASAVEQLFERDYWGLSYRQGVAWVVQHDTASHIPISAQFLNQLYTNTQMLPSADRRRVVCTQPAQARYFLTIYRQHPQPYPPSTGREVYCIRAQGVKILSVFQRY